MDNLVKYKPLYELCKPIAKRTMTDGYYFDFTFSLIKSTPFMEWLLSIKPKPVVIEYKYSDWAEKQKMLRK